MKIQGSGIRGQGSGSLHAPEVGVRLVGPALILLAAALATLPLILRGPSCGHDFDFHLVSWFDAQNSWRHGLFYPHWAPSANFGAGEPRFVFYPPLTWMLGAALGLIVPWAVVPLALTFVLLAGTGLATRALARQALADAPATLAGCCAIFSGYTLFTAYERTAFGELAGGIWIPLLLLFALRTGKAADPASASLSGVNLATKYTVVQSAFDGSSFPLALIIATAWLSNAPLGVMACYLLAFIALTRALVGRSWGPVLRAAVSVVLGIALAAFFLVPAAWEQRWVAINQATDDPGERIENSFLFARHADTGLQFHDLELHRASLLAVSMLAVTLLGLLIAWKRGKLPVQCRWWVPLAGIPLVILFLQFPVSLPLWNLLPKLRFLQFPWRWLVALEAPMGIFFAAAIWPGKAAQRKLRPVVVAGCLLLFLGASLFAARSFFQVCDEEDAVSGMVSVYRSGAGFPGTDEYFPNGFDGSVILQSGQPDACLGRIVIGVEGNSAAPALAEPSQTIAHLVCEASFASTSTLPEHLHIVATLPHSGDLILRRINYPAWQMKLNGQAVLSHTAADVPLIVIPVAKGPIDLTVDWRATPDVLLGRWITALAVLLLTALCALERKIGKAHLS
jgi:hypothetical protein